MRKKQRTLKIIKLSILVVTLLVITFIAINYKKIFSSVATFASEQSSKFVISFDALLGDDTVVDEVAEEPINGLNLQEDDTITYKDAVSYQEGVNQFFETIGNKDYYYKNFSNISNYYAGVENQLTGTYFYNLTHDKTPSVLTTVFNNIYKNEYTYYSKANIIGFGKTLDNTYLDVEIVAVGDTVHFFTQSVKLYLDEYHRIDNVELLSGWQEVENTTTPISKESILYDSHKDFLNLWGEVLGNLTNQAVYQDYLKGETSDVTYRINTLIEKVSLPNKDYDVLKQLFIAGKGSFANYGVVEYHVQDIDMTALTTYQMKFSGIEFTVVYNRLTNQIENILLTTEEKESN